MYNKFWNQFLMEASQSTFDFEDDSTRADPQTVASQEEPDVSSATGVGAYLISKGFYPDKELGRGKDGVVVGATNKRTGQKVAVKFVRQTTDGDMRREAKNYETIKNKRNSLGEFAKHFPVVYSSSIEEVADSSYRNGATRRVTKRGCCWVIPDRRPWQKERPSNTSA
jgi:hypothetical protein